VVDRGIALDPDQEVKGAVRAVFELFEREGTATTSAVSWYGAPRRWAMLWRSSHFARSSEKYGEPLSDSSLGPMENLGLVEPRGI